MANKPQQLSEMRKFGNERIEMAFRKTVPIDDPKSGYPGFAPGVTVADSILIERDVAVPMRDGIIIYTDIYRPEGTTNVPAIVAWSPYGKRAGYLGNPVPGVPAGATSPMAKFEGPDPAYWCRYGYAVINPDIRGSFKSEGDLRSFCSAEGKDCYDLIEWVAAQKWCSGNVAMSGNSWLAIVQWFAAAEKPPHLTAIAPWEGFDDFYRDSLFPGGIPEVVFVGRGILRQCGSGRIEDVPAMMHKYPLMNAFWEDKSARVENIEIPTYVVASWTSIHSHGTFDGYRRMPSPNKWLRVHNTMEWPDYYTPENLEDLRRFFDRYLKGIRNGWEFTPRVRLSVLDAGGVDQVNRPEKEFPLARTQYQNLYLDASTGKISPKPVARESLTRYKSDDGKGQATFIIKFDEDTELIGYMKLHLWVEADGADDMDLFVYVQKLDKQGNFLPALVMGRTFTGFPSWLRVSHRELDEARSTPAEPFLTHRREQLLSPKEIVPVEIGIGPISMLWHAGQQLRVVVQGYASSWMDTLSSGVPVLKYELRNRGDHIIHTGGKFDSHLLVPKIPR
jgi:predicted acyl esterase